MYLILFLVVAALIAGKLMGFVALSWLAILGILVGGLVAIFVLSFVIVLGVAGAMSAFSGRR